MKKMFILVTAISILLLTSLTASAHQWDSYDNDSHWRYRHHSSYEYERGLPFAWHDRFVTVREHHRLVRVHDHEWNRRFPGLHAYKWSGPGFWHEGRYVTDAVLFFDSNDELVSIGYMADGVFIHFREDHRTYENHDSFFFSWSHR
jgi:hypothetical protein